MSFINGIAILLPIGITIAIIRFLVSKLNSIVLSPILKIISPVARGVDHVYIAKALIFTLVILTIALIGWGAKILVINRIFSWGEKLLIRVPIMGRIYKAIKQISSAFLGQGKTIFKQVVLVEYPRKGLYSIGFTTGVARGELRETIGATAVNVFIPTTPNPTSGIFLVVPRESVRFLKMSVEEGMKLHISGGSVLPPFEEKKEDVPEQGSER